MLYIYVKQYFIVYSLGTDVMFKLHNCSSWVFFHIHNMKYTNLRLSWEIAYHCQNNPTFTQNAFKMQFKFFYVCTLQRNFSKYLKFDL